MYYLCQILAQIIESSYSRLPWSISHGTGGPCRPGTLRLPFPAGQRARALQGWKLRHLADHGAHGSLDSAKSCSARTTAPGLTWPGISSYTSGMISYSIEWQLAFISHLQEDPSLCRDPREVTAPEWWVFLQGSIGVQGAADPTFPPELLWSWSGGRCLTGSCK